MTIGISFSGGQNNTTQSGSLGGQRSDTLVTSDTSENFFDNISRTEGLIGKTEYRCGYIYNPDATTYTGITIQLTTNPLLSQISLGLDPVGKGDGRTSGVAQIIVTEDTTPTGVGWFSETNVNDGAYDTVILPIGILRQGECVPFWMKRKTEQGVDQVITFNFVITHDAQSITGETYSDGGAFGELIKVSLSAPPFLIGTARIGFSEIGPST